MSSSQARSGAFERTAVLLLALVLAAACTDAAPDLPTAAPRVSDRMDGAPVTWFQGRVRKLPPWADPLRARLDARRDGWPGEALAPRLEALLGTAIVQVLSGADPARALAAVAEPGLRAAGELRPATLATLLDDGVLHVAEARRFAPVESAAGAFAAWRAGLGGATPERCDVRLETWTPQEDDLVRAEACVRLLARGQASVQTTAEWTTTWRVRAGEARLVEIEPRVHTEVRAAAPVVREVTLAVLGADERLRADLAIGDDARHLRRDRLGLDPFLGMRGVAVGDVDGDGLEDLYVCQPTGLPNRLLRHLPDGTVQDVAAGSSVAFLDGSGPALIADLDGDGAQDLAVGTGEALLLAWNDGRGTFPDGNVLRAPDPAELYGVTCGDPDLDGDLDLYVCRYVEGGVVGGAPAPYHDARNGARNLYWRNEGQRRFRECAAEVGLDQNNDRFSLAAVFEDLDDDGDPDLYVTNDFGRNNLYRNDGGRFTDVAAEAGAEDVAASMGAAIGDLDLDGDLDIYVTNMESPAGGRIARDPRFLRGRDGERAAYVRHARGNTLLWNEGGLRFRDGQESSGARRGGWAWGSTLVDWNADGLQDLLVPNGFLSNARADDVESFFWRVLIDSTPAAPPPTEAYLRAWEFLRHAVLFDGYGWNGRERHDAYLNVGGRFVDASRALGLDFVDDGRGAARCDWDGDGLEDLWVVSRTGPRLRLLLGSHPRPGRTLTVELQAVHGHPDAVGAVVSVVAAGRRLRASVRLGDGYLTGSSKRLVLGLGAASSVESLHVRWPGGATESFAGAMPGGRYRLVQDSGRVQEIDLPRAAPSTGAVPAIGGAEVGRIPLCDRLPMAAIEWTAPDGGVRTVRDHAGSALVVVLARAADPGTAPLLRTLADLRPDLARVGARAIPWIEPEPGGGAAAVELLSRAGARAEGGIADKRLLQVVEVLLVEVLGPFDRLPLPAFLFLDSGGALALVRCGPSAGESILADAAAVGALDPTRRGTEALLGGGRWARPPERELGMVAQVFELLGRTELAAWYREEARRRPGR